VEKPVSSEQRSIAEWLLRGPAQVMSGPHAGAVAGVVDADGQASYAYPEITGYFLQWLAWRASHRGSSPELVSRAAAAQQWLAHWLEHHAPPLTRVDLRGVSDDWRNRAVFCFDLAMVLRGVASAARLGLIVPDPAVVAGVMRQLRRLVGSDGLLNACVPHEPTTTLPQRWSTSRGGFLAKAAAGVLVASSSLPDVDETVRRSADATYAASLRWAVESPHDDVHPLLYTFEGILALPQHAQFETILPQLASQFDSLLADAKALGRIPESRQRMTASTGPERLDILAQMIRVGHLLQAHRPQRPPDRLGLARFQQILVQNVRRNGAVPFAVESRPTQYNTWAAMFAEQALGFVPRDDDPRSAADLARLLA
jgi:hypothetical protein